MAPLAFRRKKIRTPETFGARLAAAREHLRLSIADAEAATHIRAKYLRAFEEGRFDLLPETVYAIGFLNRYATFLGLPAAEISREFSSELLVAQKLSRTASRRPVLFRLPSHLSEPRFVITPKLVWIAASLAFVLGVAGYVWWQIQGFMAAPPLEVALPTPEMVVSSPSITIAGRTDATASVTINAEKVATAPDGAFSQEVRLANGINMIEISARNRLNKETRRQIRVLAIY